MHVFTTVGSTISGSVVRLHDKICVIITAHERSKFDLHGAFLEKNFPI